MTEQEPTIEEINKEIEQDNDTIETTMTKLDSSMKVLQDNLDKIKTYLMQQNQKIKNHSVRKTLQQLESNMLKTQITITNIQQKLAAIPPEKLYTPLYKLEEEEDENNPA